MSELTNAAVKFPLAISSFGVQKLLGILPMGDSEAGRKLRANLYRTGDTAKKEFSTNTAMFGAFQFADKAQTALIDFAADTVSLRVLRPTYMWNAMSEIYHGGAGAIGSVATATARRLLREQFGNTFDVISFVNHVDAPHTLSSDGTYPVDDCIERLYSRGDYPALWLIEGLGERYAEAYMEDGRVVRGLLSTGKGASLPDKTQLMMHAGIGITFAKKALNNLTPCSSDAEVNDALRTFLELVEGNSQDRYKGAALESLGLVTRTWYGQMVNLIYDHLTQIDVAASEYFWHGAGRAMYFSPMYMLPGFSPWHAAKVEPPNEVARRNAIAGVAWAFTIVNVRQPEIASNFLTHRADEIEGNDAFTDGVYSTLIMAGEMVPGHRFVTGYLRYKPDPKNPDAVSAWNRWVGADAEAKVNFYRQTLKAYGKLGEVFRYHALGDYVNELAGPIAAGVVRS
jgi:hypothetical protein